MSLPDADPWLAWPNDGLMTARTPWSGYYSVDPPVFAAAHTSQFAAVGSWLLSVGAGSGYLTGGGSYVSPRGVYDASGGCEGGSCVNILD